MRSDCVLIHNAPCLFKKLAAETKRYTEDVCTEEDIEFLRSQPIQQEILLKSIRFYLVHAVPTDPLFGYCPERSERWQEEIDWINADVLVVGHTHTPFVRTVGKTTIVNPGSLGQPKTGRPLACYALWEDGKISLKEYEYPLWKAIEQIRAMPISVEDQDALITVLQTGVLQPQRMKSIKTWIFSRVRVLPATSLILTNRRIMTISTSKDKTSDRYGIVTCYTAPCNLRTASVERTTDGLELCLEIKNSRAWQISFADEQMPSIVAILGLLKRTFDIASRPTDLG